MQTMTAVMAGQEHEANEAEQGMTLSDFTAIMNEIQEQPAWRAKADRQMDYCDGNQLDSEILRKMQEIGMPPAIEPLIGPTIDSVLGMEAKSRTDWRVIPDGDKTGDAVAAALNFKLNQAERHSRADTACSDAYASQIKVGIGWVEVSRESDPFRFPYRCEAIHRNEIFWDWLSKPDLSNARYLVRRKWTDRKLAKLKFPDKADLIEHSGAGWLGIDPGNLTLDGGSSTDLAMAWADERGWSIEEQEWRDVNNRRVCLFEVWYRDWVRTLVLKSPDGRVVEFDHNNPMHVEVVASGAIEPTYAVVGKVRVAMWLGPHRLHDGPSPYRHNKFPYVPFWGKREDRTGVPFGLVRGMMYLQDEVNARIAKMQWGLASVVTTRTQGAVVGTDEQFRNEVARVDADIILDANHMAKPGATFNIERNFQLNQQQYERLVDAREGIKRTGGIYNSFMGQDGQAKSGVAISGLVEQSTQTLADINDNAKTARQDVGDLLMSLIIDDLAGKPEKVHIDGKAVLPDRVIDLNVKCCDPDSGIEYLDNDVERTKLKVTLSDVPSTASFRTQQLAAMSEAFKSAPPEYQKIMMPHLFALMDVPNREDIIKAIKEIGDAPTPEDIQKQIDAAVADALTKARFELEREKLRQNQPLIDAQVKKLIAESVNKAVEGMFSATQAANQIAANPDVAPMADQMLRSADFVDADAAPVIPAAPTGILPADLPQNTSPLFPDQPATPENPALGMNTGIEGGQAGAMP